MEILTINHKSIRPSHRSFQSFISFFIMSKSNITGLFEVDIVFFLQFFEDFLVMVGDICNFRNRESGTTTGNIAPGTASFVIGKERFITGLCHVTEQRTARNTASGNKSPHFHRNAGFFGSVREDIHSGFFWRI